MMRKRAKDSLRMVAVLFVTVVFVSPCFGSSSKQSITPEQALENFDYVWETIRDTHFDVNLNGVDWDAVRTEMRPQAEACKTLAELRLLLRKTLGELGQSHFNIIPASIVNEDTTDPLELAIAQAFKAVPDHMGKPNVGLDVATIAGEVLVTEVVSSTSAAAAGVHLGWVVEAVAGYSIAEISERVDQACLEHGEDEEGSRDYYIWAVIGQMLSGQVGESVELRLRRGDNQNVELTLAYQAVPWEMSAIGGLPALPIRVESRYLENPSGIKIGLIKINYIWLPATVMAFEAALAEVKDADGLIIDIRGNMGGVAQAAQGVAGYLTNKSFSFGTSKGRFGEFPNLVQPRSVDRHGNKFEPLDVPLALLIDHRSASSSELFAAALQDALMARLFGQGTMGAALPAVITTLPNGDKLLHAIYDFVRTNGERIEENPVQPDTPCETFRQDLLDQRDVPRQQAAIWLAEQIDTQPGE